MTVVRAGTPPTPNASLYSRAAHIHLAGARIRDEVNTSHIQRVLQTVMRCKMDFRIGRDDRRIFKREQWEELHVSEIKIQQKRSAQHRQRRQRRRLRPKHPCPQAHWLEPLRQRQRFFGGT